MEIDNNNNRESAYTKEYIRNIISRLEKRIHSFDFEQRNDSIGKQLGLFEDFNDVVLEINSDTILFPDFFMQLKISPRKGWNGRGSKN